MDQRRAAAALLALAACIACSAAAPTASNHTALELHDGPKEGCYYNFQHYGEGDRIMTNEPCLNCTCHNRMLMCYLRVCPFTKAIGQDCTVEKRADQCCPIVTCPDVPVDLLTSTSTSSPAEYGTSGLGKLDKYGCSIHGKYFPEGSKVPPTPNKPCEHCYCIRNMTTCVMQECTLHVDGCTPIYHKDVCCPVRYSCDHPEDEILRLDDMTTTVRPTPGFLLTTTTVLPVTQMSQDCVHDEQIFPDGALIKTEKACEHCYCMKGDIVCVVQECGTPMENEGKNCTSLPPRHGQCCPDTYICEGDERIPDSTIDVAQLTTPPPRRIGVEGSGYRNEPDEPYTDSTPSEIEGSGEDFATIAQTIDNLGPEKTTEKINNLGSEIYDETLYTITESNLQVSESTEYDKGQNTIPDSIDKDMPQETIQDKVPPTGIDGSVVTISDDYTTSGDLISQKIEPVTTESAFRKEDEPIKITTLKEYEKVTTESGELLDNTTFKDKEAHTISESLKPVEQDQKLTTLFTEYTDIDKATSTSQLQELTTETLLQSIVTEKNTFTNKIPTTGTEISVDSTTAGDTNVPIIETTSINPNVNEIDDNIPLVLSPSRIPGEGDCLLNGITYRNNTSVPSTNNCQTSCKCVSSIIKCDPIICSPPPEYLQNMNDCHPVYDTPESCCPTYVCSQEETLPPESHSQMSGTESPKPAVNECSGSECIVTEEKESPVELTPICKSGICLDERPIIQEECLSEECKKNQENASKPQDCNDGKCQISSEVPCEGDNCKVEQPKETTPEKVSSHDVPSQVCDGEYGCKELNIAEQGECVGENCRRKEYADLGAKQPSGCLGVDCDHGSGPTVPSLIEQPTETTQSTLSDIQKTEAIELHVTTTKETITGSHKEIPKQPITYTESFEKLSTIVEQITTEASKLYETEKDLLATDIPITEPVTSIRQDVTETESLQTEPPKLSDSDISHKYDNTETPQTQETDNLTGVKLTTEIELPRTETTKYLETESEESFTEDNEQLTTKKPLVDTDSNIYGTISNEAYTKIPEITVSAESEKTQTAVTESTVTEKELIENDTPKTVSELEIKHPEILTTEKDEIPSAITETSFTLIESTETNKPFEAEKDTIQSETPEITTEKQIIDNITPDLIVTEKVNIVQTEVTDAFSESEQFVTKVPETITTEKRVAQTETTGERTDNESTQTETSKILLGQTVPTVAPEVFTTEQQLTQTESTEPVDILKITTGSDIQEPAVTEAQSIETDVPEVTVTTKEEIQTKIPGPEIEGSQDSIPGQHDIKVEVTTIHELDQSFIEGQTIQSISSETEQPEQSQVTDQLITKQDATVTIKPDTTEEKNKEDDETLTEGETTEGEIEGTSEQSEVYHKYEDKTEPTEIFVTKTEPKLEESVGDGTELTDISTASEGIGEITTKKYPKVATEQEMATISPQDLVTKSEDKDIATTEQELLHGTYSDVISQFTETSSEYEALITDRYTESSMKVTEAADLSTYKMTEKHEKVTESPEIYKPISQVADRTTEPTELYTVDETLFNDKSTEKQYISPTTDAEKRLDDDKHIKESDDKDIKKPHEVERYTTIGFIEELTSTSSIQVITEKHDDYSTEAPQQITSNKEEPVITTILDIGKKQETSTKSEELTSTSSIQSITEKHDVYTTEIPQQITSIKEEPVTTTVLDSDKKPGTSTESQELTSTSGIQIVTEKHDAYTTETPQQITSIKDEPVTTTILDSDKKPETSTDSVDIEPETTTTISEYSPHVEGLTTKIPDIETLVTKYPYEEITGDNLTTQLPHKNDLDTEQQQTISQDTNNVGEEVTESYLDSSTKSVDKEKEQKIPEIEIQKEIEKTTNEPTTLRSESGESSDKHELESTLSSTVKQEPEVTTEKYTYDDIYTVKDEEKESTTSDEKLSETTESVQGIHITKHTYIDLPTTQAPKEISTEKLSVPTLEDDDKTVSDKKVNAQVPETATTFEQSEGVKDSEVTTESRIFYTSSEDKGIVTTIGFDDRDVQKEQELYSDTFLTTVSSLQPESHEKITKQPMSLVTDITHEHSTQTVSQKDEDVTEKAVKPSDKQELEDDKKQTRFPELPITQTQPTSLPEHHITQEELETENPSEITNLQDSSTIAHHVDKLTTSILEDEYNIGIQTTPSSIHHHTINVGIVTDSAILSGIDVENKESTPIPHIDEETKDIQQETTTELSPPIEKEPNLSHEHEAPLPEPIDQIITKLPYDQYTTLDETHLTTSKYVDVDDDKSIKSTEAATTEQQKLTTEYPEMQVQDIHTILPEKETSETTELAEIDTPTSIAEKEPESSTSIYQPIITNVPVKPIPVVTEIIESGITEKGPETTETAIQPISETTAHVYLDVSTEAAYLSTQNKLVSETAELESSTQVSEKTTDVFDEIVPTAQNLSTKLPEHDEYIISGDSEKEKLDEHVSHDTTQLPEVITLITETQTDSIGTDKDTHVTEGASEAQTTKPSVTEKEAESQTETQSTIEKEAYTTGAGDLLVVTEKAETLTDDHTPTEFILTTLGSSKLETSSTTEAHPEVSIPEESGQTTESEHEYSETTPFLVELKEHTHQIIDESSRAPIEEVTTVRYEPQQTERGDQNLYVIDKQEDEYHTEVPIEVTQHVHEEKEKPLTPTKEQAEQEVPTTISIDKDFTETSSKTEAVPTSPSIYTELDLQELEKKSTTVVQDLALSTSTSPETVSEKELYTTASPDVQNITYPTPEPTSYAEESHKSEAPIITTLSDEDLEQQTSKATTSKTKEETSTHLPSIIDKSPEHEEKPVTATESPAQEAIKPGFDDEINEGVPPSGAGGYGQEPDYVEEDQAFGPGTCRYGGKVYVSAQQIPRDDPCDFCFCFRSDIICLQQSCPPPIHGCHEEPIQGFCCPRYECPVSMATTVNVTTTTTTTTTTLPPHFFPHAYKGAAQRRGCQIKGHTYKVGEVVRASSGPCLHCTCGGDGQMKCDPKACTPEPMLRQMIAAAVSAKRRR